MLTDDSISQYQNQHSTTNNSSVLPVSDKRKRVDEDSLPVTKKYNIDIASFQRNIQTLLNTSTKKSKERQKDSQPKCLSEALESIVSMYAEIELLKQQTKLSIEHKDREITNLKRDNIEQADQISSMHRLVLKLSRDAVIAQSETRRANEALKTIQMALNKE